MLLRVRPIPSYNCDFNDDKKKFSILKKIALHSINQKTHIGNNDGCGFFSIVMFRGFFSIVMFQVYGVGVKCKIYNIKPVFTPRHLIQNIQHETLTFWWRKTVKTKIITETNLKYTYRSSLYITWNGKVVSQLCWKPPVVKHYRS